MPSEMTPERLAEIRERATMMLAARNIIAITHPVTVKYADCCVELLAEIDRLRAELDGAKAEVCSEIQSIMGTYREQEASSYGVDTPGGLEHMGDVWRLLARWDEMLSAAIRALREKP